MYIGVFQDNIAGEIKEELSRIHPTLDAYILSGNVLLLQVESMGQYELGDRIGMSSETRKGTLFLLQGSYHGWYSELLSNWLESNRGSGLPLSPQ